MDNKQETLSIPYPDANIFKYQKNIHNPASDVVREQAMFIFERVEYPETGGIFAYFRGCAYPQKGFPFPEALYAVNAIKRITIQLLGSIDKSDILSLLGFVITPHSFKVKSISRKMAAYINGAGMFLDPYYLKEQYYSSFCREMRRFMVAFLTDYGIEKKLSEDFSDVIVSLIDYDNAYRLRAEDIFSETTKEALLVPQKELKRLIKILAEREPAQTNIDKFEIFSKIIGYLIYMPRFKRAYKKAWKQLEIKNFQLDEADRHHVLLWSDYNFLGKPLDERIKMYIDFYGGEDKLPPRIVARPK